MPIPDSLLNDLDRIPPGIPVKLLMRHSVRFPILRPEDTYVAGLTEEGVRLAEELGVLLGRRFQSGRLRSAPVERCRDTAKAIARGAGWPVKVRADQRISHPFIAPVWALLEKGALNGVLPGQVQEILRWVIGSPELPLVEDLPRLDVLVTHDTVVGVVAAGLLHAPIIGPENWPGYLEGALFWREEDQVHVRWRGMEGVYSPAFHDLTKSRCSSVSGDS